ncbi:hypothetical protein BDD12DRAFT_26896 [Trichophaea hybrida]|nr:hypothetical protein BDD12DRAFT_26896 [Trichophaea hybrida]
MAKDLDALSQELAVVKASSEKEIADVNSMNETLQKQIEALSEEIMVIKSERDTAKEAAAEVEMLSEEITTLKDSKEATSKELVVLSEELATDKAALETAKTELKAALEARVLQPKPLSRILRPSWKMLRKRKRQPFQLHLPKRKPKRRRLRRHDRVCRRSSTKKTLLSRNSLRSTRGTKAKFQA